jgi:hypothetical protein
MLRTQSRSDGTGVATVFRCQGFCWGVVGSWSGLRGACGRVDHADVARTDGVGRCPDVHRPDDDAGGGRRRRSTSVGGGWGLGGSGGGLSGPGPPAAGRPAAAAARGRSARRTEPAPGRRADRSAPADPGTARSPAPPAGSPPPPPPPRPRSPRPPPPAAPTPRGRARAPPGPPVPPGGSGTAPAARPVATSGPIHRVDTAIPPARRSPSMPPAPGTTPAARPGLPIRARSSGTWSSAGRWSPGPATRATARPRGPRRGSFYRPVTPPLTSKPWTLPSTAYGHPWRQAALSHVIRTWYPDNRRRCAPLAGHAPMRAGRET